MMRAAGTRQKMDVSQPQASLELGQHAGSSGPVPEPLQMLLGYAEEASSDSPAHDLPGELCRDGSVLAKRLGPNAATCPALCKTGALKEQTELSFDVLLTQDGHHVGMMQSRSFCMHFPPAQAWLSCMQVMLKALAFTMMTQHLQSLIWSPCQ